MSVACSQSELQTYDHAYVYPLYKNIKTKSHLSLCLTAKQGHIANSVILAFINSKLGLRDSVGLDV